MKNLILALLFSTGAAAPVFAAEPTITPLMGDPVVELNAETLEYLASHARISVGTERGTVVDQMGEPSVMLHPDVWLYKHFRASNVFSAEQYDLLVVGFKNNKVAKITLTNETILRAAAARQKEAKARAVAAK